MIKGEKKKEDESNLMLELTVGRSAAASLSCRAVPKGSKSSSTGG